MPPSGHNPQRRTADGGKVQHNAAPQRTAPRGCMRQFLAQDCVHLKHWDTHIKDAKLCARQQRLTPNLH